MRFPAARRLAGPREDAAEHHVPTLAGQLRVSGAPGKPGCPDQARGQDLLPPPEIPLQPSHLPMGFCILRGWPWSCRASWALPYWCKSSREMPQEDLYRSTASPGTNFAIGHWIMARGEDNPRPLLLSLPSLSCLFLLFVLQTLGPGGLGGLRRGEVQCCVQGWEMVSAAESGSGFCKSGK